MTPGRSVRLAPTSARVCAKLFEIARASRTGVAISVMGLLWKEAKSDAPASISVTSVRCRTRSA